MTMYLVAVGFLITFLVIAFIAFKMLKKSVRMAVRIAVVAIIITVAVAGSAFFFISGSSKPRSQPKPAATR